MKWLETAWSQVGVEETGGPAATPEIVAYFRDAGRPEVASDEVAWCAAFVGACLARNGIHPALPRGGELRARAYLEVGTAIDSPRIGAIAVFRRGSNPALGHVGFVTGASKTHIALLGGNQANTVSVAQWPKSALLGLRWPEAPRTPSQIAAGGSRIARAAGRQQTDAAKTTGVSGSQAVVPPPPARLPGMDEVAGQAGSLKGTVETLEGFALFAWGKWPWIAGALAAYWLARMAWDAWLVRRARAEDANTGVHVGAGAAAGFRAEGTQAGVASFGPDGPGGAGPVAGEDPAVPEATR